MSNKEIEDIQRDAIESFISYFKNYTRDNAFDQFMLDGRAEIEDLDDELDVALKEYLKMRED